jgi:UDP-N-acetyl-D-mannosaminuronic acid transferase (WecB/TagA/CpsF family)
MHPLRFGPLQADRQSPAGACELRGRLRFGSATDAACLLIHRRTYPSNLNGTDLTPAFLSRLPPGRRVFLYGARRQIAAAAPRARFDNSSTARVIACSLHRGSVPAENEPARCRFSR